MDYILHLWTNLGTGMYGLFTGWGLPGWGAKLIIDFIIILLLVILGVLSVIVLTPMERKVIARMQDRPGPNRAWPYGLSQAFADAIKMLTKEMILPKRADRLIYTAAPILIVIPALMIYAVLPFSPVAAGAEVQFGAANLNIGVLYFVALGSVASIAILMAGWGSNNKFALLGAFRVVNQLIAYEVPMILSLLAVVVLTGTMATQRIVEVQSIPYLIVMPIAALTFLASAMAELNRSPFDLLEAESELVAGYQVEYGGMKFAMFYIAEYVNILSTSILFSTLFLGGYKLFGLERVAPVLAPFIVMGKAGFVFFFMLWTRGTFPRIRLDQLVGLAWKFLVPLTLVNLVLVALVVKLSANPWAQAGLVLLGNLITLAVAFLIMSLADRRLKSAAPAAMSEANPLTSAAER
jgi:NADH-quinone oxidoreductase subunit H